MPQSVLTSGASRDAHLRCVSGTRATRLSKRRRPEASFVASSTKRLECDWAPSQRCRVSIVSKLKIKVGGFDSDPCSVQVSSSGLHCKRHIDFILNIQFLPYLFLPRDVSKRSQLGKRVSDAIIKGSDTETLK